MDVKLAEFKRKLLETGLFEKVSREGQYRCKVCPYCGDAKSHLYVLIRQNDDIPVLCNCFKCNHKGLIDEKFLDYFGIDDMDIPLRRSRLSDEMEISCPFFKEKPRKYGAER